MRLLPHFSFFIFLFSFLASCSFDYGNQEKADSDQPDIVMNDVEYVRVRSGDPTARFQAEKAERYEERGRMQVWNFIFEQYGNHGEDVNALGRAGSASIEIDSGDITMDDGVWIDVDKEDVSIETKRLDWKDKAKSLSGGYSDNVTVTQKNGTVFSGVGFRADARLRTWEFSGGVSGTYIHKDKEESPGEAADEKKAGAGKD